VRCRRCRIRQHVKAGSGHQGGATEEDPTPASKAPRWPWNEGAHGELAGELATNDVSTNGVKLRRVAVDWNRIEGNWKQLKGKIKEKWGDLTDDDLDKIAGRRDQLEGLIQQRYGLTKDRARAQIEEWFNEQKVI
jgi:uncharacterized protein YjbJ (UPF0337 family)